MANEECKYIYFWKHLRNTLNQLKLIVKCQNILIHYFKSQISTYKKNPSRVFMGLCMYKSEGRGAT